MFTNIASYKTVSIPITKRTSTFLISRLPCNIFRPVPPQFLCSIRTPYNQARTASCFTISFIQRQAGITCHFLNGCFAITNHTNNELTCYFFTLLISHFFNRFAHTLNFRIFLEVSDSVCQFSIKHIIRIGTGI